MSKLPKREPPFSESDIGKSLAAASPLKPLQLPPVTEVDGVSYRHEVNPAIALSALSDIQSLVIEWQSELRAVVAQIQKVYAEGPVVDGWLESIHPNSAGSQPADHAQPGDKAGDQALLRHADIDQLMAYVQSLDILPSLEKPLVCDSTPQASYYRLCRLDASGNIQVQICPPEQIAVVSMAIVRHQKLSQLVARKGIIEVKLQQVVDGLRALKQSLSAGVKA